MYRIYRTSNIWDMPEHIKEYYSEKTGWTINRDDATIYDNESYAKRKTHCTKNLDELINTIVGKGKDYGGNYKNTVWSEFHV